jgi:ribosomal protein S27AE
MLGRTGAMAWMSDVDQRGVTMERVCVACGGSGLAEHVDRTLPPPPCRLCHPEEAALHTVLARETRTIVAARRLDVYQMLRTAIVLGAVVPPAAAPALLTTHR